MSTIHNPRMRRNSWQVTFTSAESGQRWRYTIPVPHLDPAHDVRAFARRLHAIVTQGGTLRNHAFSEVITDATFIPELVCRERAVGWAALHEIGAMPEDLRSEDWVADFLEQRRTVEERALGFGVSLSEVMAAAALRGAAWDLGSYRDRFGRVNWETVRADIRHGAMSVLRQTPYGLLWIDHG